MDTPQLPWSHVLEAAVAAEDAPPLQVFPLAEAPRLGVRSTEPVVAGRLRRNVPRPEENTIPLLPVGLPDVAHAASGVL